MYLKKRLTIFIICLHSIISQALSDTTGIVTNEYGRISNIENIHIHVSASLTLTDCVRQCTDFSRNHLEYISDDCFAYNYDLGTYTCELIHSTQPLDYTISFQTQWMTGFKYQY